MSFGRKLISMLALAFILVAFNIVATAQETPSTDKPHAVKKDGKHGKHGRRGMRGKHGRKGRRGRSGRRGRRGGNRALKGITLNDSQKQQLQTLFKSKRAGRGERGKTKNTELRDLVRAKRSGLATTAQQARLKQIAGEMQAKRKANREQMSNSIRSILTSEQQTQYDKNIADAKKHMEGRKKHREDRKMKRKVRKKRMVRETSKENG